MTTCWKIPSIEVLSFHPIPPVFSDPLFIPNPIAYLPQFGAGLTQNMVGLSFKYFCCSLAIACSSHPAHCLSFSCDKLLSLSNYLFLPFLNYVSHCAHVVYYTCPDDNHAHDYKLAGLTAHLASQLMECLLQSRLQS